MTTQELAAPRPSDLPEQAGETETRIVARVLTDRGWRPVRPNEDASTLIADGSQHVWVDIFADPHNATTELRRLRSNCPQLHEIKPEWATKGGDYPPHHPPKAKAFGQSVFLRAYWLGATESHTSIRAQEVRVLAGKRFAITLRYPSHLWNMQDIEKPKSDSGTGDRLEPGEIEKDVMGLHQRLGRRQGLEEAVKLTDSFGLEVAIAVLDQVVDSVFESLNAIRLKADRLEGNLLRDAGRSATVLLVPTLVAGLWGMNFAYIPGANLRQGFWIGLLILAIIAVGAAFAISWYLNRTRKIRPSTATNQHTTTP